MLKFEPTSDPCSLEVIRVHENPTRWEEFIGHLKWHAEFPPRFSLVKSFPYVTLDEMREILSHYETKVMQKVTGANKVLHYDAVGVAACNGRAARTTTGHVLRVTCKNCMRSPEYRKAMAVWQRVKEAR